MHLAVQGVCTSKGVHGAYTVVYGHIWAFMGEKVHTVPYLFTSLLLSKENSMDPHLSLDDIRWLEAQDELLTTIELPSVKAKRDKQYLPALRERVFVQLVVLPGKSWAVYMVLLYRCRLAQTKTVPLTTVFLTRFGIGRRERNPGLTGSGKGGVYLCREAATAESPRDCEGRLICHRI